MAMADTFYNNGHDVMQIKKYGIASMVVMCKHKDAFGSTFGDETSGHDVDWGHSKIRRSILRTTVRKKDKTIHKYGVVNFKNTPAGLLMLQPHPNGMALLEWHRAGCS
jgi:hypothetical protein